MRSRNPGRRSKPPASGNLPAHGKKILAAAYENAKQDALERGLSESAAKRSAAPQAWCAVKRHYYKRGERWIKRKDPLGRDEHPPGCTPLARRRRRNPMLSRQKREALARELGRGLHADATVDELLAYMRSIENLGRIAYDEDLEVDPTTPQPDLEDLWNELWVNYGEDTLGNPDDPDDDEDDEDDDYGRVSPSELHYAESDFAEYGRNPKEIWVVVAPEKHQWPVAPLQVVTRDQAIALTHARGPGVQTYIALRTGFPTEHEARSYADKVEHAMIEVSRPSDGTVVYRGSLLGFSEDPATRGLKFVDRGRLVQIADTNVETKLGQGKKALVARRERSENPNSSLHWNELGFDPPLYESDPIDVPVRGLGVFRLRPATHYVRNKLKPIKFGKQLGYDASFIEVLEVGVPGRHRWGDSQKITAGPLVLADAKRAVDLWLEGKPFTSDNGRIADVYPKGYTSPRNPYLGDAVELAQKRKYDEERARWEKSGRRGPPPAPPRSRRRNPGRVSSMSRRISGV